MNSRVLVSGLLVLLAVVAAWATVSQRRNLQTLRAEQNALLQHLSGSDVAVPEAAAAPDSAVGAGTPPELLQLRSEVARLTARKRQLASVQIQNQQLRQALAAKSGSTNAALAPGFVRKTHARFAGFSSPQDTLQSYLWALQNRDATNLLRALVPAAAQQLQAEFQGSDKAAEKFFEEMQAFIGFRVLEQRQSVDGSMQVKVEVVPELPPADIRFNLVNGQWLMELPR